MLVVKQKWSTGEEVDRNYVINLGAVIHSEVLHWVEIGAYGGDLAIVSAELNEGVKSPRTTEEKFLSSFMVEQDYVVKYNYFTITVQVAHDEAVYDDGVSEFDFPCYDFEKLENSFSFEKGNAGEAKSIHSFYRKWDIQVYCVGAFKPAFAHVNSLCRLAEHAIKHGYI